jgi:hypothetical protein
LRSPWGGLRPRPPQGDPTGPKAEWGLVPLVYPHHAHDWALGDLNPQVSSQPLTG